MASGKAFFMLRGVDSALWTAARQQAQAEGVKITDLVERLVSEYMSADSDPLCECGLPVDIAFSESLCEHCWRALKIGERN